MDLGAIERSLRGARAGAIVADPRLVRRVIKAHRDIPGLGLSVPHARCYALRREALLAIVQPGDLVPPGVELPPEVVLLARPSPADLARRTPAEVLRRLWRAAFHARVHLEIERRVETGALSVSGIRERIDRIGQTEFDEVRSILRHDDLLLPPADDREAFTEFAALYLELKHFAPALLPTVFPGLPSGDAIAQVLAADVDARGLLDLSCPEGGDRDATILRAPAQTTSPTFSAPPTMLLGTLFTPRAPTPAKVARLLEAAGRARARRNAVRAALLCSIAAEGDPRRRQEAKAGARAALEGLGDRLEAALRPPPGESAELPPIQWTSLLVILAEEAAVRRGLRFPVEARLLHDLQRAALAHEQPRAAVDLVTWALTAGRRRVVRPLPAVRELYVARYLKSAQKRIRHARIVRAERKLLAKLLGMAVLRADANVRAALRPRIVAALEEVGLRPANLPERLAQDKLVQELLDQAVMHGRMNVGHLRDAISRNQLKLQDLAGPRELWAGDALLRADRLLATSLDGVYRPGEIYLRAMQKGSSMTFGTRVGRAITLYLALPLGGAFVVLEGATHVVGPLVRAVGLGDLHLLTLPSFLATAAAIFGLVHSRALRAVARRLLGIAGAVLSAIFFRVPRWILTRRGVRRALEGRAARALLRHVAVPAAAAAAVHWLTPVAELGPVPALAILGGVFAGTSLLAGSRLGLHVEDLFFDWLAPTWSAISRQVLPGLFRLIVGVFRTMMELVERVLYRVDEWLRFRQGESRVALALKAAIGLVWFAVAYVVRVYITLLVEPEINPLKHFPVVTVAHKLLIPFTPELLVALQTAASPLGAVVGGAVAGTTVFLLPSVFGFLAWELKENWKLYRATRPAALGPALIGRSGETMGALMIPGFHSGTLPKLYERMRRAAQREDATSSAADEEARGRADATLGRFREGIEEVEDAVRHFVERELLPLLAGVPRWTSGPLEVAGVLVNSNRVRVRIACPALGSEPCEIAFEEQSELIVAGIASAGFLRDLPPEPSEAGLLFENALAGLYHLAGVDLVREQVEAALGGDTPYDVSEEGLVAWPGDGYRSEAVYPLRGHSASPMIDPVLRGDPLAHPPPPLDRRQILYRHQGISWSAWVHAWSAAERADAAIPRLIQGASLLPAALRPARSSAAAQDGVRSAADGGSSLVTGGEQGAA